MSELRPRVGISACLVGQRVRYNGSEMKADWLRRVLAQHVDLIPLCPEVAMGLGVPREALRLTRDQAGVQRLQTSRTKRDLTEQASEVCATLVAGLPEELDGYLLAGRSPTCGPGHVKVYDHNGIPQVEGTGVFARELMARRPELVVTEAGRLLDRGQREHFLLRLYVEARARRLPASVPALMAFHRQHKFLFMAQGPVCLRRLGRLVAAARKGTIVADLAAYRQEVHATMALPRRRTTTVDALSHMYGFVKTTVTAAQGVAIRHWIEEFARNRAPLAVPLSLLNFCLAGGASSYLEDQAIFRPYPEMELEP